MNFIFDFYFIRFHNFINYCSFYGHFEMKSPSFVLRSLDLIKKITVKDFDYFMNRRAIISAESDPLLGNALILLTGQKWRDMRATLSPAFTGSKMRNMFSLVTDCVNESIATIKSQLKQDGEMLDMKEFFSKFTVDTIATCAFGNLSLLTARSSFFIVINNFWQVLK